MSGLGVTATYIAGYLDLPQGGSEGLSKAKISEANDWLEQQFAKASVPLPTDKDSLGYRAAQRATAAYFAYLQARQQNASSAQDGQRVQKLKDGDSEITFAPLDAAVGKLAADDWLAAAWLALSDAGVDLPSFVFPGASR